MNEFINQHEKKKNNLHLTNREYLQLDGIQDVLNFDENTKENLLFILKSQIG